VTFVWITLSSAALQNRKIKPANLQRENPMRLIVRVVKVVRNPPNVIATKVKAKMTPPIRPLRSLVELSPKYAKQDGNPKPKDTPNSKKTAQITGKLE
jgi:hypothetical protein